MLNKILQTIEESHSTLNINQISYQLSVEPAALSGMLDYLVHTGKLVVDGIPGSDGGECERSRCGIACPGAANCPFVAKMPKMYQLNKDQ